MSSGFLPDRDSAIYGATCIKQLLCGQIRFLVVHVSDDPVPNDPYQSTQADGRRPTDKNRQTIAVTLRLRFAARVNNS